MSKINNPVNVSYTTTDDVIRCYKDYITAHPVSRVSFDRWSPGGTQNISTDTLGKSGYRIGSASNGVSNANIIVGAHAKMIADIKVGDTTHEYTVYGRISEYYDEELGASITYFGKVIINTSTGNKTIGYVTDSTGKSIDSEDGVIGFAWGDPRLIGAPTVLFLEFTSGGPIASAISFVSANLYFEDINFGPSLNDIGCYLFKINNFNNIKSMYIDTCAIMPEDFYGDAYGYYGCQAFTNTINIPYEEYSAEQAVVNFPEADLVPTFGSITRAILLIGRVANPVNDYIDDGEYKPYLRFKLGEGCYPRFINFNYTTHNESEIEDEFGNTTFTSEPSLQVISLADIPYGDDINTIYV